MTHWGISSSLNLTSLNQKWLSPSATTPANQFLWRHSDSYGPLQLSSCGSLLPLLTQTPTPLCTAPSPGPKNSSRRISQPNFIRPSLTLKQSTFCFVCAPVIGRLKLWLARHFCGKMIKEATTKTWKECAMGPHLPMWTSSKWMQCSPSPCPQSHLRLLWPLMFRMHHLQMWQSVPIKWALVPNPLQHCMFKSAAGIMQGFLQSKLWALQCLHPIYIDPSGVSM